MEEVHSLIIIKFGIKIKPSKTACKMIRKKHSLNLIPYFDKCIINHFFQFSISFLKWKKSVVRQINIFKGGRMKERAR